MLTDSSGQPEACFECGKPAEHRHHVVPRSKGGKRTVPLCHDCHDLVHFRVDDTGSLLRHAYLSAHAAAEKVVRRHPAARPLTAVAAPPVEPEEQTAPPGMTWLPGFKFPVRKSDLEVVPGDIEKSEANGEPPEFYAEMRAKIRARRH